MTRPDSCLPIMTSTIGRCRYISAWRPLHKCAHDDAWRLWLDRMGLDADRIPLDTAIVCDDDARQIVVTYIRLDEDGRHVFSDHHFVTDQHTIQLEAPALPTPVPTIEETR